MKTKNCPFCGKEISDEAIICKFCHRLLIDENGNDILPEGESAAPAVETAVTEDKTIVYKKEDLQKLMNKKESDDEGSEEDTAVIDDTEVFDDEELGEETTETDGEDTVDASAVIGDETDSESGEEYTEEDYSGGEGYSEETADSGTEYTEEGYDEGYSYETEDAPPRRRRRPADDRYDDSQLADVADYDPRRTFIITAIVTLGILLIIIVAILVGYKLFNFGGDDKTTGNQPLTNTVSVATAEDPAAAGSAAADTSTAADVTDPNAAIAPGSTVAPGGITTSDNNTTFVPSVVNDTVSANPEEIINSSISDPVVDSAATTPEASADTSSAADDGMNIVIRPDPNADTSTGTDDNGSESQEPGDGPSSANSTAAEPAGPGAPGFDAAGSYYSWGEAETLMANYAASNNLGYNYEYYGGTDGVEMMYAFYDENGNATVYRVDLQTGYVSAY